MTLTMTRDRAALLRDIRDRKVWRTATGRNLRSIRPTAGNGYADTIAAKVGELEAVGWATLGPSDMWVLTADGEAALAAYDGALVTQ